VDSPPPGVAGDDDDDDDDMLGNMEMERPDSKV